MNQKDRNRMAELYSIHNAVPFPASGASTTSIAGLSGYTEDMREIHPWITRLITGISLDGNRHLTKHVDYYDPDIVIAAIKEWIEERKADRWQNEFASIDRIYKRLTTHIDGE